MDDANSNLNFNNTLEDLMMDVLFINYFHFRFIHLLLKVFQNLKKISIDGPYGTASGRILDSEHAVLIAGGLPR